MHIKLNCKSPSRTGLVMEQTKHTHTQYAHVVVAADTRLVIEMVVIA